MAKRRLGVKVRVQLSEDVTQYLIKTKATLHSPAITLEVHRGAAILAAEVKRRAPRDTGALASGVYVASTVRSDYREVTRQRNGQRVSSPLRYPPKAGQVLVAQSVFYTLWVEKGRKAARSADKRGVGRMKRRPYFRPGIRAATPLAESYIKRRLEAILAKEMGT
jgi:hypothetical protein